MFNASISELQSQISYYQEQCQLAEQELDRLKMTEAFAEDAASKVEEALEHIDPKYLDVFKEHLLALFPTEAPSYSRRLEAPVYLEESSEEENDIEYMNDSNADYKSIEQLQQEDPDTVVAVFDANEKHTKYQDEDDFTPEQKEELDWQQQLIRTADDIFYDPSKAKCYMGFSAKGRADDYGSYLTRILDIAEKYTVSFKPTVTTNTKYELVLEEIDLESAQHLSNFNLKKEFDDSKNKDARESWRTTRKRIHPPACKPNPKLVPLEEVKLGDIVYLNSHSNQYKVLAKVELDGVPHLEVVCVYNSERPSLVGLTSFLKEAYRVLVDDIQIDPHFKEQEEVLTEDVNIYIPKPKGKPLEIPVIKLSAADTVHRGIGDSHYEVIGTARKDNDLYAECRLISSSTRAASIGNTYFFKDGLYLVEGEPVAV